MKILKGGLGLSTTVMYLISLAAVRDCDKHVSSPYLGTISRRVLFAKNCISSLSKSLIKKSHGM